MKVKNLYIEKQQEEIEKMKQELAHHDCTQYTEGYCVVCERYNVMMYGGY